MPNSTKPDSQPKLILLQLALYFSLSFVFHLTWENSQSPLYESFESFAQHFPLCLFATATGDMIFMLTIYIALAAAFRRLDWLSMPGLLRRPATWILPVIIGGLLAVSFELWAIHVEERWSYGSMPIIPVLQIGLLPVIQMLLIPLVVIVVTNRIVRSGV